MPRRCIGSMVIIVGLQSVAKIGSKTSGTMWGAAYNEARKRSMGLCAICQPGAAVLRGDDDEDDEGRGSEKGEAIGVSGLSVTDSQLPAMKMPRESRCAGLLRLGSHAEMRG